VLDTPTPMSYRTVDLACRRKYCSDRGHSLHPEASSLNNERTQSVEAYMCAPMYG
jgi:hypothetical protein